MRGMRAAALAGLVAAALLTLGAAGRAAPAPITLDQVAAAASAHNAPVLRQALDDKAFLASLGDPQTALDVKISIAEALDASGDKAGALAAYQAAITDVVAIMGANDPQHFELLRKTAALRIDLKDYAGAVADLDKAVDLASASLGDDHPTVTALQADDDRAWAAYAKAVPNAPPRPPRFASRAVGGEQFDLIQIYYATHRKPTGETAPARFYGGERGPMQFGTATISVPRDRATGSIPRPNIFKLEFRPDPEKHVILTQITPFASRGAFFDDLTQRIGASERKEAFVFIHGFNSSFEAAAWRTGQLAADLSIDGAPILYSWPSRNNVFSYDADNHEADIDAQVDDLAAFLADVSQKTGAKRVHLVAHSLGNRFLTKALYRLAQRGDGKTPLFDEIVMGSPDISVGEFQADWPAIRPLGKRFTLYASKRDMALLVSDKFNHQPRLGDGRSLVVMDGIQTVDTTAASGGLLGHADFDGNALDDFRSLIWDSLAPQQRCVLQTGAASDGKPYWMFAAGGASSCTNVEFRDLVTLVRKAGSPVAALKEVQAWLTGSAPPDAPAESPEKLRARLISTYNVADQTP